METPMNEFCPAIREYVLIDQTQMQCAVTCGCILEAQCCPLQLCFLEPKAVKISRAKQTYLLLLPDE